MEKRTLLAFALSAGFLLFYFNVILPMISPQPKLEPSEQENPEVSQPEKFVEKIVEIASDIPPPKKPAEEVIPEKNITIETDLFQIGWTNRGASMNYLVLKNYNRTVHGEESLELISMQDVIRPFMIELKLSREDKKLLIDNWKVVESDPPKRIVFQTDYKGVIVKKIFNFRPEDYAFDVTLEFSGTSPNDTISYVLYTNAGLNVTGKYARQYLNSIAALRKSDEEAVYLDRESYSLKELKREATKPIVWLGMESQYFAAILYPQKENLNLAWISMPLPGEERKNLSVALESHKFSIMSQTAVHDFLYFVGPKQPDILKNFKGMGILLDYGMFRWVSRPLLFIMHGFYKIIPNYGLAIIFLTLLVRLLLFPINIKQQSSMYKYQEKMQTLKPKLDSLKEKYKNNRQKQTKEMMRMYREEGISPLPMGGGCLTGFLLQMPVFLGLYRALQYTIELRQAPFMLWINDLSEPDLLISLGSIPLRILPLAFTGMMIFQQSMSPKSSDPQQAQQQKMMMWMMPVMFLFIFYSMPSGLTLYFVMSTGFGLIEQRFTKKRLKQEKEKNAKQ